MFGMRRMSAACLCVLVAAAVVTADVNLELRPVQTYYRVGESVHIGLYAVSDSASNQPMSAMDVILTWDPSALLLVGVINNGPYAWLNSTFFPDSGGDGLNNTFNDGDAKYTALAQFGNPAQATPAGLLVTTLHFQAVGPSPQADVNMPATMGNFSLTAVYGHPDVASQVTGQLIPGSLVVCIAAADGDMNEDGDIDARDVQFFNDALFSLSPVAAQICHGDFDNDDTVDFDDIQEFVDALLSE